MSAAVPLCIPLPPQQRWQTLAFTVPVVVTAAPTTLTVVAQETGLNYSDAAINVQKIGVEPTP